MGTRAGIDTWLLGRAQDGGVPHLGCDLACCAAARAEGRVEYPCSLGVRDHATGSLVLIDATPAVEPQIAMLHQLTNSQQRGRRPVDAVLLTHAHIGHYAGLLQFGKEVAAVCATPVYCTPRMANFVRTNAPWSALLSDGHIELVEIPLSADGCGICEPLPGLSVEAIVVPHRDEYSDTVAFRLRGSSQTVLWAPDVDQWGKHSGLAERLLDGVDVAYVDGTFFDEAEVVGRDLGDIPHPFICETMTLLGEVAMKQPGRIRFIHFNHTNPVLRDAALRAKIEGVGFGVAAVGESVLLSQGA
ncbi:MAG: MBL fold metallo-hydrolase [Phycisphaerales bacterium]|jgi:pyrroloquinoline quinone biosynthesis protein B|nr:MBL fold metallo-hydrolase [Phycisphaerales bacterium]